jgi:hypothetical protein
MDQPDHVGLTRRELERELAWMMKRLPDDPKEFVKLLCQSLVALIDKNNAAIAKALERRDEHSTTGMAPHQESKA